MKNVINKIIQWLAESIVGVWIYKLGSVLMALAHRFFSFSKAQALFPGSDNLRLDARVDIKYPENITFGSNVIIGAFCQLGAMAPIRFGNHVRLSRGVIVETATLDLKGDLPYKHKASPILIGDGVWIGANAMVLGGVIIGNNAVIGAGAVVSRDVRAGEIIVSAKVRNIERRD